MKTGISNCGGFGMRYGRGATCLLILLAVGILTLTMRWIAPAALATHVTDAAQGSRAKPIPLYFVSRGVRAILVQATADQALREARVALAQGHLDEALRYCQEGVRLDPTSALAQFLLGMIQIRRGDE